MGVLGAGRSIGWPTSVQDCVGPRSTCCAREAAMHSSVIVLSTAIVLLVVLEFALRRAVRSARQLFQWMITEDDALPELDRERLESFLAGSFSAELGWEPVPGTTGQDQAPGAVSTFTIGPDGARLDPSGHPAPTVAAFGDSYAFCRQVDDDQTWAAVLGRTTGIGVQNFGVGNYGIDQALLRYLHRRDRLQESVRTVMAVFVPETVCRVQSVWKHWMEFGNTFGFKPRFVLDDGQLELVPSPVSGPSDFDRLETILAAIGDRDPFRSGRFQRLQFRKPYLIALLRAPLRHLAILWTIHLRRGRRRSDGATLSPAAFDRAFAQVMRGNVTDSHRAYSDPEAVALLTSILERFRTEVEADGRRFIVCVIPQLLDLATARRADRTYRRYFADLGQVMEVVDLTPDLRGHLAADLYVNDRYGGHLSVHGNHVVAERLRDALR